jgi:para-nitrobenzyl esterase
LQWIQRNIAKFGGDPDPVMIFGHSAGGANVNSLVASPLAKGLFRRALMQSGNSLATRTKLADAEKAGLKLAEALGATSISALRQKPAEELLKAPRDRWESTSMVGCCPMTCIPFSPQASKTTPR